MTLGAKPGDVLRLVLGQGLRLAVMGAAIGIIGAFMLTRLLTNLLYAVKPTDPLTFFCGVAGADLRSHAGCYVPARSVTRADPMVAIRYE